MGMLQIFVYFVLAAVFVIYFVLRKRYSYWAERGIVHEKPVYFYGNLREFGRTKTLGQPISEFYLKYKNEVSFGGFYLFMRRAIVLFDLELVKTILIKDFANFSYRGNYYNERDDPLSAHLFNLDGPKWKAMRTKLTPTFTSGKMKFMLPTIVEVAEEFVKAFQDVLEERKHTGNEDGIEVKDLLARFTTDVIGTCAFGINCNSLKDPQTEFRVMSKKVFTVRRHGFFLNSLMNAYPDLGRWLGLKALTDDVSDFFMRVVRETVEYREREGVKRNDFMDLLIELKNQKDINALTLEEIAAQSFVFFLAGFETSSSTMGFVFYELAINQDIQDRARAEIKEMFQRHDGKLTYDGIRDLKYLRQILLESMRKYSIASFLLRKTLADYKIPNTNHVIEKGIVVIVPVEGIHYDPDIYPNPEIFDPERFSPEEMEKRSSVAWLPFGEGPRNCIGSRFGEMQAIVGLAMLLKNFRFSPSKETKIPIELDKKNFLLSSKGGIILKVDNV